MSLPTILGGVRRSLFIQLIVNAVVQLACLLVTAGMIRYAFDHFLMGATVVWRNFMLLGTALPAAAAICGWLQYKERVLAEQLGQSYVHSLRRRMFQHVTRIPIQQLQKRRRGAVMLRFISDLNAIRRWVSLGLVRLIVSGAIVAGTLAALSRIDWVLSIVSAAIIAGGTFANATVGASLRTAAIEVRKRRARLSANINEKISQMAVVQTFGRTQKELKRVRKHSHRLRLSLVARAKRIGLIRGINYAVTAGMTTAVLIIGIARVDSGHTTPGTIAAALAVMGFLVPALRNLGRIYEYYQDATVARRKINDFLSIRTPIKQGRNLPELDAGPGQLVFENVSVPGVLDHFSGSIEPGQKVALIGPNGAGKSTLMALAARMVAPEQGRVLIDGQDIASVKLASVREAIGMVGPDLPLLAGSLEMNIGYRSADGPAEAIDAVKTLCGIEAIIDDLPDGDRTRIQERGRNLSAGQRQRIALARAMLGTPRILLLDEVDAHLDAHARRLLFQTIQSYPGTVLWATHLDAPFYGVDVVWRVENGRLIHRKPAQLLLKAAG